MFKTLALVLTLSLTAIAGTNKENSDAFHSLPLIESVKAQLEVAVGPTRAQNKLPEIATRWDQTAMMGVVAKWVEAEKEKDPLKRLRLKELVKRRELRVEAEIWRMILGKGQEKPFIANEDEREKVVQALAGDEMIRSLSEHYRDNLIEEAKKLANAEAAEQLRKDKEAEALEGIRAPRRAQKQIDRADMLRQKAHSEFSDDLFALTDVKDVGEIGSRPGMNNKARLGTSKGMQVPAGEIPTMKGDNAPGDLPQRDVIRAQIMKQILREEEMERRHGVEKKDVHE